VKLWLMLYVLWFEEKGGKCKIKVLGKRLDFVVVLDVFEVV
jgi:hypothetical protein